MTATSIGICADNRVFHVPCANRVYGEDVVFLAMYPQVYETERPVYDAEGSPVNTIPDVRVSPEQRDFADNPITILLDQNTTYMPEPCGYPLCHHPVDGTDVIPEDVWVMRRDQRMRRYALLYTQQFRVIWYGQHVALIDCPVEQLEQYLVDFAHHFEEEPVVYIGGNNLAPQAVYEALVSVGPLKVLARSAEQVTLDFSDGIALPVKSLTGVWETVVLARQRAAADMPRQNALPWPLRRKLYAMLQSGSKQAREHVLLSEKAARQGGNMTDTLLKDVGFDSFRHTREFDVTITRDYQLKDFYLSEQGSDVYVDVQSVLSALRFRWVEIQMRGWTLRVEPELAENERPRKRRFVLIRTEAGGKPKVETMDFEDLFLRGGIPNVGLQVLALMNEEDFISLEHCVGRTHIRIVPKEMQNSQQLTLNRKELGPGDVA